MLTRQAVQLFSERSHNDVILHDVRHLVLQVLLIERDQGIRAGIPNLNERPIMPAVYKVYPSKHPPIPIYRAEHIKVVNCRQRLAQPRTMRVTNTPPAGLRLTGAFWGAGHLSDIFCDEDFCKHFRGNTNNKWHVCGHDEPVNIYPQPKVAGDIVLGFCNSSPESTISAKRQGGEKCLYKVNPLLACNYADRTHHSAVMCCCCCCCYYFFPTCHKVGGYTPQQTTNGSGFATCDKWLGRKIYWDQPKNCFGFV